MKIISKKVFLLMITILVVLAFLSAGIYYRQESAAVRKTAEDIREKNSLLSADMDFRGLVHLDLPGLNGDTWLFFDDDYAYYTDSEGFIERIDSHDLEKPHPESVTENFSPERLNEEAIRLFDSVFFVQERKFGRKLLLEAKDFNGADYMVTIVLLDGEQQTGNKAVISFDGDGKLISSMYIKDIRNSEEDTIPEERAKELALEYFYQKYAEDLSHAIDPDDLLEVSCGKADFIIHQGIAYWDVSVTATYAKTAFLQEPVTDPGSIRINAETGEYIWFASTFK